MTQRRVLFVCTGNICRSPTAEGVFRKLLADAGLDRDIEADSAGTQSSHVGHAPDGRSQAAAKTRGYDLSRLRARKVKPMDFVLFDLVLAMDDSNFEYLRKMAPEEADRAKVRMLLSYAPNTRVREVPDPYYGAPAGFELVLDLTEEACRGLVGALRTELGRE